MGAFIVDIDGTVFKHGTNELLPGALEYLKQIKAGGHWLAFTTQRGDGFSPWSVYHRHNSEAPIQALAKEIGGVDAILWNVPSPRIVINDDGAIAIDVKKDKGLEKTLFPLGKAGIVEPSREVIIST